MSKFNPTPSIVRTPITTVEQLRDHLKMALRVELSTIPLYLYAMYSIPGGDDGKAKRGQNAKSVIRSVVVEEMLHLSLVGNLLLAIGERPILYDKNVIPRYPSPLLCRIPDLMLYLRPGTQEHIQTFVDLELPEDPHSLPEDDQYHTIGQFYKAIEDGFAAVAKTDPKLFENPQIGCQFSPTQNEYTPKVPDAGGLVLIKDLESACTAIRVIVLQGEGFPGSKFDDPSKLELCHYALFKQLMDDNSAGWDVYNVPTDPKADDYQDEKIVKLAKVFSAAYCYLLKTIEHLWTVNDVKERKNIVDGSMYAAMRQVMGPIADLLPLQNLPGQPPNVECPKVAAPTFEYYEFTKDPKTEMSNKMEEVIKLYQGSTYLPKLTAIKGSIDNLYWAGF